MKKVTWYETLEYMLNHAETDQRNLSRNFNLVEPAAGCDGSWERMRQMAENIRKEMLDVRFGTKERRGTEYVKANREVRCDGMGRGKAGLQGDSGLPERGSDREDLQAKRGDEEVRQDQCENGGFDAEKH